MYAVGDARRAWVSEKWPGSLGRFSGTMIFSLNFGSFIPRTCMMDVKYPSRSGGICRGEMKMMLR